MYQLISDGGTMTVGRRTASYVWGEFQVTLNDGLEQAEPADDRLTDAFIYRPDDRGTGRAELTFVRADAQVDMNAEKSDLEQTLDGASRRTEGEAFYTREISGLGLGRTKPGVHYVVGDLVNVLLWGRRMTLPVSAINAVSTDSDPAGWSVQVGGQMLRDAEAQRKRNSQIDVQIAREKRQRLKEAGQIRDTANSAAAGVKDLNETLAGPSATSDDVLAEMQALAEQLTEHGEDAPAGLIPAYMASNNERWRLQTEIDRIQDRALALSKETLAMHESWIAQMQDTMGQLQQTQTQILMMNFNQSTAENEWVKFSRSGNRVSWTVKPGWTGSMTMLASVVIHSGGAYARDTYFRLLNVPNPEDNWMESADGVGSIQATITVNPGVPKTVTPAIADQTVGNDWTTLTSWTLPKAAEVMLSTQLWWENKSFLDRYDLRVTINGQDATSSASQEGAPLIGQGRRKHVAAMDRRRLPAGSVLAVQAKSNHGNAWNRQINGASAKITWIDEG